MRMDNFFDEDISASSRLVQDCIWIQMSHPGAETFKWACDFSNPDGVRH